MKHSAHFRKSIGLFIIFILGSACASTRVASLTAEEGDQIDLYVTKFPERQYVELCYIQTDGTLFHTPQKLLDGLKEKGRELGADALIQIKYDFQAWYPVASGIAIKYVD